MILFAAISSFPIVIPLRNGTCTESLQLPFPAAKAAKTTGAKGVKRSSFGVRKKFSFDTEHQPPLGAQKVKSVEWKKHLHYMKCNILCSRWKVRQENTLLPLKNKKTKKGTPTTPPHPGQSCATDRIFTQSLSLLLFGVLFFPSRLRTLGTVLTFDFPKLCQGGCSRLPKVASVKWQRFNFFGCWGFAFAFCDKKKLYTRGVTFAPTWTPASERKVKKSNGKDAAIGVWAFNWLRK